MVHIVIQPTRREAPATPLFFQEEIQEEDESTPEEEVTCDSFLKHKFSEINDSSLDLTLVRLRELYSVSTPEQSDTERQRDRDETYRMEESPSPTNRSTEIFRTKVGQVRNSLRLFFSLQEESQLSPNSRLRHSMSRRVRSRSPNTMMNGG